MNSALGRVTEAIVSLHESWSSELTFSNGFVEAKGPTGFDFRSGGGNIFRLVYDIEP